LYANVNDVPIPNPGARSAALQENIINLQPFNKRRRQENSNDDNKSTNDDMMNTNENELSGKEVRCGKFKI
jgi:hypothetical protein